jgi:hypothetical protein
MMTVEVTVVPQCRGGLAPAVSLCRSGSLGGERCGLCRVPCVAMAGSQACPLVMTACRCRRVAAAMMVCAWVGLSLFCSLLLRYW